METESQRVIERYEKRKFDELVNKNLSDIYFSHYIQSERELKYTEILKKRFPSLDTVKLLEIGAGMGGNLFFFKRIGFLWENLYVNELLPDRIEVLKETFPKVTIYQGDASEIESNGEILFDVVFQSTVFTSLLDYDFKVKLANKMWTLVKPGGIVLWYDFMFNNPKNQDVRGIKKAEIINLFPKADRIVFQKVTLAPPIGRKVKKLYSLINTIPFLRTHIIAEIEKGKE
jgi:SAM-dependent methyltransferase